MSVKDLSPAHPTVEDSNPPHLTEACEEDSSPPFDEFIPFRKV